MEDDVNLTLTADHTWQGPIPSSKLQSLKSFVMTGLKDFDPDDLDECSHWNYIPYEDGAMLSIETRADGLTEIFDEENTLKSFPKIELHYEFEAPVDIKLPSGLTLPKKLMERIQKETGIDRYIADVKDIHSSPNGFSSIFLQNGFQANIIIDRNKMPKSMGEIYLVISKGNTEIGEFEYLHGLCINHEYYDFSDYGDGGDCDCYRNTYYDETFNLMCSFSHWFAGLDVEQIGESYISSVDD